MRAASTSHDQRPKAAAREAGVRASRAFQEALLRSEVGRAYAVMVVLLLSGLLVVSRELTGDPNDRLPRMSIIGLVALFLLQVGALLFARWARSRGRGIPAWFATGTVILENLVPTGIMLLQILPEGSTLPPYAVLCAPPILAYGFLVCLTTLRLRPMLCILGGAIATSGYVAVLLYVRHGLGITEPTTGLPRAAYISIPVLLFISGIAAAWVAKEIRSHMDAALREADTRHKMERIEQDLSVARSIQRALLPKEPPSIPGYDIAGWNRPADQTGGDYYDWQQLPDGRWIISLADVSGHGIGPALVTAACRAYVRASSRYDGNLPSLISRINTLLADDLPDGRFVTLVSVLISPLQPALSGATDVPDPGTVGLLSAGHGPVLLWVHSAGTVEDIHPHDLPLAIMPDLTFGPPQAITLATGDVLALITDGFFEWSRPRAPAPSPTPDHLHHQAVDPGTAREQFGLERLRDSLRRHASKPASEIVESLAADIRAFAGAEPQQDDLTVVIIKRTGSAA